jgi:MFS family permease
MTAFLRLLRENRNYRAVWTGQVVSEIGDHFNNIAVLSLAMEHANAGLVVTGVFLSRAVPMLIAGPVAGVLLDRMDRRRVMIASDLARAVIALGFIFALTHRENWILFALSAMLMFASPFFTSGRSSILPSIATPEELHTANTMTQTTAWASLTIGTFLGAVGTQFGYKTAFLFNTLSFLISAFCVSRLHRSGGFKPIASLKKSAGGFREYVDGLRYMRSVPLFSAIALISVGWASGGGAAQVLFSLFGEKVFHAGPMGIGVIWGCAGIGLLIGGTIAYWLGKRITFDQYKWTIGIVYVIHGGAYVLFSQMPTLAWACVFIALSRGAVAISSVLNVSQLMHHVDDRYRGRIFATLESLTWSTMMVSMMAAGAASTIYSPRTIGAWAGAISSTTAVFWTWRNLRGKIPEPPRTNNEETDEVTHAI